jgi:hypothetical protein
MGQNLHSHVEMIIEGTQQYGRFFFCGDRNHGIPLQHVFPSRETRVEFACQLLDQRLGVFEEIASGKRST